MQGTTNHMVTNTYKYFTSFNEQNKWKIHRENTEK